MRSREPAARVMGLLPAFVSWAGLFVLPLLFFFIVSFWSVRGLAMRSRRSARGRSQTRADA